MAVESIFYSVSGISCRGALIWEEGVKASRPLLLMAPNWRGVIKPAIEAGQTLAGEGYVVFVADMNGRRNSMGFSVPTGPLPSPNMSATKTT